MNREIRFRGKDAFTGKWVYGDLAHNKKVTGDGRLEDRTMVGGYEVDPYTVGQFVGLCDAEGEEIYEGDLVEFTYKKLNKYGSAFSTTQKVIGEVATDEYGNHYISSCNLAFHISNIIERKAKAIGNIHDNPELLKGGLKCFTL